MREMIFTQDAYNEILKTVGTLPAETGGILLGNRDDYVVQKFVFDKSAHTGSASYDPDLKFLNNVSKESGRRMGWHFWVLCILTLQGSQGLVEIWATVSAI